MDEQLDLADVAATILAFHINKLTSLPNLTPGAINQMAPDMRSAYLIWLRLKPFLKENLTLESRIRELAQSPSESTRQAVSDELHHLFETEYQLRGQVKDIALQSPYAVLMGGTSGLDTFSAAPDYLTRPSQSLRLLPLFILAVVIFGTAVILTMREMFWGLFVALTFEGILVYHYAQRLNIKRPLWLAVGAALPCNIIYILVAMAGYRRMDNLPGKRQVYYSALSKALSKYIIIGLFLLPIMLWIFGYPTIEQTINNELDLGLAAVIFAAYALLILTTWIAIWHENAESGIGIALASTISGWASSVILWITIVGPKLLN